MKKLMFLLFCPIFTYGQFWTSTEYKGAFPVTDGTTQTDWSHGWSNFDAENTIYPQTITTQSSDITTNTTLSGVVLLQNKIYVTNNSTLTILPGTIIRGDYQTQGTLIVTKGSKIIAEGTQENPIIFTSNEEVGNRAEGDWGGLVILGRATNNQPNGVANIEGIPPTSNTEYGGGDDLDNSGILKYVRVEFAGIPLEPNKEINGITFGSVGSSTIVDYVQVSFSGDDSFEWFGGTVNCKHLIAYKGIDDDFDTDFGYRGNIQFGLAIRDLNRSDAPGDSNCFESDNDATGSSNLPQIAAIFSNITTVGPLGDGTNLLPEGEKFEKAFRLRRNTSISIFNSLVTGWEKGLSIEGTATEENVNSGNLVFSNNTLTSTESNCVTASVDFYGFFSENNNDSLALVSDINWVDIFSSNPDARLNPNSTASTGADFSNSKFGGQVSVKENGIISNVQLYPNPTSDVLNISGNGMLNVNLFNTQGQLVLNMQSWNYSQFDVSRLQSGIYVVQVNDQFEKIVID